MAYYFIIANQCRENKTIAGDVTSILISKTKSLWQIVYRKSRTNNSENTPKTISYPKICSVWVLALLLVVVCVYCMPFLTGLIRAGIRTMSSSTYIPGTHSMAFVTVPNIDVAKKLAHGIIQNRLAACVNIIPGLTSVYEWKGKVEEDSELLMMIKTATDKVPDLSKFVRENHPYECAEVISSKIDDGNPPYLKWIGDTVSLPVLSLEDKEKKDS